MAQFDAARFTGWVSVAIDQLGARVTSLSESGQTIADALDELLTRSWG